ncbi:hypothetical protein ACN28S_44195 [Cystobacter fuscus]
MRERLAQVAQLPRRRTNAAWGGTSEARPPLAASMRSRSTSAPSSSSPGERYTVTCTSPPSEASSASTPRPMAWASPAANRAMAMVVTAMKWTKGAWRSPDAAERQK